MKIPWNIFIVVCGVLLFSCQDETLTIQNEVDADRLKSVDDNVRVSPKMAEHGATMFIKNTGNDSHLKSANISVKDIATICDDNGDPSMYVINYDNDNGFVIVGATRNYYPVLAFSEDGYFDPYGQDIPAGVVDWVSEGKDVIRHQINEPILDSITKFREMWKMYETENLTIKTKSDETNAGMQKSYGPETYEYYNSYDEAIMQSIYKWNMAGTHFEQFDPDNPDTPAEIYNLIMGNIMDYHPATGFILSEYEANYEVIGPLLTTKWGQFEPYNRYTPNNYPTGCVATAMAQVMKYHRWPSRYNWDIMENIYDYSRPTTEEAKNEVARLMREAGAAVDMDYGSDGSGAKLEDVPFNLMAGFGYSSNADHSDYNYSATVREIRARRPVLLGGNMEKGPLGLYYKKGHAWVCDGYTFLNQKKRNTVVIIKGMCQPVEVRYIPLDNWEYEYAINYIHMNWGHDGRCDAWFSPYNWSYTSNQGEYIDYKYNRRMVTNIYPYNR